MNELKLVVINDYENEGAYILALNESQIKLLQFLTNNFILDKDKISWTINVTDAIALV